MNRDGTEGRDATQQGWVSAVVLAHDGDADAFRVLTYPNGNHRFQHRCDGTHRGGQIIICAPQLNDHHIEREHPLTLTPSILCSGCGLHGHVTEGAWVPCGEPA